MDDMPATEAQKKRIWALEHSLGRIPKWRNDMTRRQASTLIDDLQDEEARVRGE